MTFEGNQWSIDFMLYCVETSPITHAQFRTVGGSEKLTLWMWTFVLASLANIGKNARKTSEMK